MDCSSPKKNRAVKFPNSSMCLGRASSTCRSKKGRQISISTGDGGRLPGGLQATIFVSKTSSRPRPIAASIRSSKFPARPEKGIPSRSQSAEGIGPTTITPESGLPDVKTVDLAPFLRLQPVKFSRETRNSSSDLAAVAASRAAATASASGIATEVEDAGRPACGEGARSVAPLAERGLVVDFACCCSRDFTWEARAARCCANSARRSTGCSSKSQSHPASA